MWEKYNTRIVNSVPCGAAYYVRGMISAPGGYNPGAWNNSSYVIYLNFG